MPRQWRLRVLPLRKHRSRRSEIAQERRETDRRTLENGGRDKSTGVGRDDFLLATVGSETERDEAMYSLIGQPLACFPGKIQWTVQWTIQLSQLTTASAVETLTQIGRCLRSNSVSQHKTPLESVMGEDGRDRHDGQQHECKNIDCGLKEALPCSTGYWTDLRQTT